MESQDHQARATEAVHWWIAKCKLDINPNEPNAYVYFEPNGEAKVVVPVRLGRRMTKDDWLRRDEYRSIQGPVLHPFDADYRTGDLGVMYNDSNGWPINYGALRMLIDWFIWEPRWHIWDATCLDDAPNGPVLLYGTEGQDRYPMEQFIRDWPMRFRRGMPYMRDDFDVNGKAHEQLQEEPSTLIGQSIRFKTMCSAFLARIRFGAKAWDRLNVY